MTTEIEAVTVTFEEFKASLPYFMAIKETQRVSVIRDGREVAVLGSWLPGEERIMTEEWQELIEAARNAGLPVVSPGMKK
jgi:hypothetical protein